MTDFANNFFNKPIKLLINAAETHLAQQIHQLCQSDVHLNAVLLGKKQMDLSQPDSIEKALDQYLPDYVINCSAFANAAYSSISNNHNKHLNAQTPADIASACANVSSTLIHLSTSDVFAGSELAFIDEQQPVQPVSDYASSLVKGEEKVAQLLPRHIILRIGELQASDKLIQLLNESANNQTISAQEKQVIHPTFEIDVARVITAIIKQLHTDINVWGTYHYQPHEKVTHSNFVQQLLQCAQQQGKIAKLPQITPEADAIANQPLLNSDKLLSTFGIKQPRPWDYFLPHALEKLPAQA